MGGMSMKWSIRTAVIGGLVALGALSVAPASAQSPPAPVGTCAASPATIDLGTHNVGETFGTTVCGPWVPGTFAAFNFDGRAAGGKIVQVTGAVSPTFVINPNLTVNVDDIVPGQCGQNILTITGAGAGGAAVVRQVTFTINC